MMEPIELVFSNERTGAEVYVTFSDRGEGKARVALSVRHDPGLPVMKMQRYIDTWRKWCDRCVRCGIDGGGLVPAWPHGWELDDL